MKVPMLASLTVSGFAVLLSASLVVGVMQAGPAIGRYPDAGATAHSQFDLAALAHGYLGYSETYLSRSDLNTVWHWYARHFAVEPEEGTHSGGVCMKLSAVHSYAKFGHTLAVTLCSGGHGTRVSVNQIIHWPPVR